MLNSSDAELERRRNRGGAGFRRHAAEALALNPAAGCAYSERCLCRRQWSPATSNAASDTQKTAIVRSASQARLASCAKTRVRSASQRLIAEKLAATTKRLIAKPTPARDVRGF